MGTNSNGELVETVDVFEGNEDKNRNIAQNNQYIDKEIEQLKLSERHIENKEYKKALVILKKLNMSNSLQIRVRARYKTGVIFYLQEEYDLAYQVFRGIVQNYSFSGIIIKSLNYLVQCCDKLGLKNKKNYYSNLIEKVFV